jgi:hypothetical protein
MVHSQYVPHVQIRFRKYNTLIFGMHIYCTGETYSGLAQCTHNAIIIRFHPGRYVTILKGGNKAMKQLQITFFFVIWRERCTARIFRRELKNPQHLAMEVMQEVTCWFT